MNIRRTHAQPAKRMTSREGHDVQPRNECRHVDLSLEIVRLPFLLCSTDENRVFDRLMSRVRIARGGFTAALHGPRANMVLGSGPHSKVHRPSASYLKGTHYDPHDGSRSNQEGLVGRGLGESSGKSGTEPAANTGCAQGSRFARHTLRGLRSRRVSHSLGVLRLVPGQVGFALSTGFPRTVGNGRAPPPRTFGASPRRR